MKSTTFFRSSGLSLSQHLYVVVLIIFFICSATSCKKEQDLTDSTSDRSTIESEQIDKSAAQSMVDSDDIKLSPEAKEIAELIDNKGYTAASTLFNNYFPLRINDATLYSQYVRYLILAYDMNDMSYIESPIKTGDRYQRLYILSIAATHAIEFDPGLKKYLSNLILKSLYEKLNETASSGIGYVTSKKDYSLSLPFDPKEFNIINFAWSAIELDPSGAKAWAAKYENLVPVFIQHGKSNSAMMTANLAGDLATEATGNADFEKATDAFLRAVLSEKAQKDTIESTAEHYVQLFSDDCKRSLQNGDKRYLGLINAIKSAGASLNHFEQKGLLP